MAKLENIHPGEVLLEEFLKPLKISAYRLSKDIGIPQTRVSEILKGRRRITADTALRLSKYFGTSAKFWLGLQDDFDIEEEMNSKAQCLAEPFLLQQALIIDQSRLHLEGASHPGIIPDWHSRQDIPSVYMPAPRKDRHSRADSHHPSAS